MYPTHTPIQFPNHNISGYGVPVLDEDFDPSDTLLPQDIGMTHDEEYPNEE